MRSVIRWLIVSGVIAGCASEPGPPPGPVLACEHVQTSERSYAPKPPTSRRIGVYSASRSPAASEVIGHVSCRATDLDAGVEGLRREAMALGAEAVTEFTYTQSHSPTAGQELYFITGTAVLLAQPETIIVQ